MAPFRRGGGEDQAERGWRQQRRTGRLHDPESDQHRDAARQSARRRAGDEHGDPEQEALLARVALGGPAEQDEQRRVDDRVRVQHPGQICHGVPADVEIARHLRQRDVDDEQIEAREHDARADDHQHQLRRGIATAAACERAAPRGI